ncbi:hypothetical protein SCP_0304870 [Sparassis crispa]|uniref:FAD-binding domain-containing protein n=1 Tax=Sparassis crispa TaxID=139825 RepID=A0A401GF16_9APHY|nr:hypothetical protein SCP_0304870 [Sparassis crispa]GBE80768.1 hypothetical protein SCP_0304870 [Sparassis crispa]
MMLSPTEDEGMFVLMLGGQVDHAKCLADHEGLIKILRAKTGRDELVLDRVKWLAEYRPNIRMVNKFGDGRVFVAGDAVHVHSPFGGQGVNSVCRMHSIWAGNSLSSIKASPPPRSS